MGSLFSDYIEKDLPALFDDSLPFVVEKFWITKDVRKDRTDEKWLNIICKKKEDLR